MTMVDSSSRQSPHSSACLFSAAPPGTWPDLKLMALFGVGAVLLRGAGCTINDYLDMDLDRQVERTKNRPLASGAVRPPQAVGEQRTCAWGSGEVRGGRGGFFLMMYSMPAWTWIWTDQWSGQNRWPAGLCAHHRQSVSRKLWAAHWRGGRGPN